MAPIYTSVGSIAYDARGSGPTVGGNVAARLAIKRADLVSGRMLIDGGGFEGSQIFARVFRAPMSRLLEAAFPTVGPADLTESASLLGRRTSDEGGGHPRHW